MYKPLDAINTPNEDTVIWKYFSLYKFDYLIQKSSLYFARADKFEDKREGAFTAKDTNHMKMLIPNIEEFEKKERLRTYLNCWIQSNHEQYLMWSAYSSLYEGIAIKTTVGKLIESLNSDSKYIQRIGKVEYIDLDVDKTQTENAPINLHRPFFTKRTIFNQENELRIMYFDDNSTHIDHFDFPVSLDSILSELYISPNASIDFEEYIHNLLLSKGLKNTIIRKSEI